jgi:hypothetical protein
MPCARSINFGNGGRWTRDVIVWFAAKSLLASKSK